LALGVLLSVFLIPEAASSDVDGDGDLDAVFANYQERSRICVGDGSGGFTCSDVSTDLANTVDVALGDLDGDGNLDAVFANSRARNRVCLGDGAGGFTCHDLGTDASHSSGVALGDIDRDRNLDAVFAIDQERNRVCLGDGTGKFTCRDVSTDSNDSLGVALAPGYRGTFDDDDSSVFEADIEWMADEGITKGCNPPDNDLYCPNGHVTRGQMAAFLHRALG
jgi:hypothetical protein